jgi:tRNA pseudouridine55 synthase
MAAGFLCVDKPPGITSRDVVNVIQRLVRPLKVGHAGTLDPLATGVLVVAVGSATRLISFVQDGRKRYRGSFRLGETSDTEDCTGTVVDSGDPTFVTVEMLTAALAEFVGQIEQTPPQFSAIHVQGQRAYDLARQGIAVELAPRRIDVFGIDLVEFATPEFTIDVCCSGGTYIRSLGRDVGQRLGCGALMTALRRTAVGPFTIERAVPLESLTRETGERALWPLSTAAQHLPSVALSAEEVAAVRCGKAIRPAAGASPSLAEVLPSGDLALFDAAGELVGIGVADPATNLVKPRLVLAENAQ